MQAEREEWDERQICWAAWSRRKGAEGMKGKPEGQHGRNERGSKADPKGSMYRMKGVKGKPEGQHAQNERCERQT